MTRAALREAFLSQARACDGLGSPFTAQLCRLSAERLEPGLPLADRLFGWTGDLSPAGESVPLRWCGAFHALRLSGRAPGLAAVYPPHRPQDGALWEAILDALHTHAGEIGGFLESPPQTNEVARSAVLIAAASWLAHRHGLPLVLSELGASAGLNLNLDRYGLDLAGRRYGPAGPALVLAPESRGALPPAAPIRILERRGVDLRPVDAADPAQALRLRAYVWPDQTARMERLEAALSLPPAPVDRGDAAAWLEERLAAPRPGALHLAFHTIAWQYFPAATQAACLAALEAAGDRATAQAPLARLSMEADASGLPGAAVELALWPGPVTIPLGRADFHGRWLDWTPPAIA